MDLFSPFGNKAAPAMEGANPPRRAIDVAYPPGPLQRVPWKMLTLIVSFFIVIHLFNVQGITDRLAALLSHFRGLWAAPVLTGFLSALSLNLMINQPTTILFANAMQKAHYALAGAERLASGLGLIVDTNLAGTITLFGALAGLMWSKILGRHGIAMDYGQFLRYSVCVTPPAMLATLLLIAQQIQLFPFRGQ